MARADAAPADRRVVLDYDPLEGRSAVRSRERPRQLPDPPCACDGPDSQLLGPSRCRVHGSTFGCGRRARRPRAPSAASA